MAARTIQSKSELEKLTREFPLVIVAALRAGFPPGDMAFERIAEDNSSDGGNIVLAKFFIEHALELAEDVDIQEIVAVVTFYRGQKDERVSGFEPPRWEEMVIKALAKGG